MKKALFKNSKYAYKHMPAVILLALSMTMLLTGCRPRAFTEEKRKQVTNDHKQEAVDWFAKNLPNVRVKDDAQAYTDGRNLLMIIEGSYKEDGETYRYLYDYEHDVMYLQKDYEAFLDLLAASLATELSVEPERLDITFSKTSIETTTENDKEDIGIVETTPPVEYLPADRELSDLCEEVLHGESAYFYYATLYTDRIPAYDNSIFKSLTNANCLIYIPPMQWEQTGIGQATYRKDAISVVYVSTAKVKENLFGGYYERKEIEVDANGQPLEDFWSEDNTQHVSISDARQDEFTMQIPTSAWPLVFSDVGYEKLRYAESDNSPGVLYRRYKSDRSVYETGEYDGFLWMSLPKSDMDVYEASSISNDNDGIYRVIMKKQEEKKE